jgi:hypothetical protein
MSTGREIVIEVRGGSVVEVYASTNDTRVVLIDWDDILDDGRRGVAGLSYPCSSAELMPDDTRRAYEALGGTASGRGVANAT